MRLARRKHINKTIVTNKVGRFTLPTQITINICKDGNQFLLTTSIFEDDLYSLFDYLYEWEEYLEDHIKDLYEFYGLGEFTVKNATPTAIEYSNKWKTVIGYEN